MGYKMRTNETFSGTRSIRRASGPRTVRLSRRDQETRGGLSKAGRREPPKARSQTQGQGLGTRGRRPLEGLRVRLFLSHLAGEFGIREALAYDLSHQPAKAILVAHREPVVEPECLLIDVAEQVST